MDKFITRIKRKRADEQTSSQSQTEVQSSPNVNSSNIELVARSSRIGGSRLSSEAEEINVDNLEFDPGLRRNIYDFSPNEVEKVRRAYWQRGPCQPTNHIFPQTQFGKHKRRFSPKWFKEYARWLEYSISKDAAYCLCCYLFKSKSSTEDAFINTGFRNWKKKDKLDEHVGGINSFHNNCLKACDDLMNHRQHIDVCLSNQSEQIRIDYRVRLTASYDCLKFLLRQGLAFRGHDESEESRNRGNFLELLNWLAEHNESINQVALKSAPENHELTSPAIQKDFINAAASITTNVIIREIKDDLFSILVDESRDISNKEQMAVVLRYVDTKGCVVERFVGIVHVSDTSALSLKAAIDSFFSKHGLSLSSLRGQGYDGASNMSGEFNGLKALILKENKSAFYVHCFAHQLQLTLVAVSKKNKKLSYFFDYVGVLTNIVGASCKRKDLLRVKQFEAVIQGISNNEIETGRGLNQERSIRRAGTRWGSHLATIHSVINLFSPVIEVLQFIEDDCSFGEQRTQAMDLKDRLQTFEFVFILHMMKSILGITNDLSQALQRKDQDIVNAMDYVKVSKTRLQEMRDDGWETLLSIVSSFCSKHEISVPNMGDQFVDRGRPSRNAEEKTNLCYYRFDLFYGVIDLQLMELNDRFDEINTELLLCMACLNPSNSFFAFDVQKLLCFAKFYPSDFTPNDLLLLEDQLQNYIGDVKKHQAFVDLKGISELAQKMVETKKHIGYPLVYLLVKLALLLPVATATVERAFSAMKIIKSVLRNRMGDELLNDCILTYIEQDIFNSIDKEEVLQYFQNMKSRRVLL